jgi:hypothetical protein
MEMIATDRHAVPDRVVGVVMERIGLRRGLRT